MLSVFKVPQFRVFLIIVALGISAASLIYSHSLSRELYTEEVAKMEVWAQAMRSLTTADGKTDLNLVLKVINSNHTIPVVVTDAHGNLLTQRNLSTQKDNSTQSIQSEVERIKANGKMMRINLSSESYHTNDYLCIYYEESVLLQRLTIYPGKG